MVPNKTTVLLLTMEKVITHKEKLSKALTLIAPNVTTADRKAAQLELGKGKSTIHRYLQGDVLDNDTALAILSFMRKRIQIREKAIGQ
jgi:hypothetical protein